jgi:hypothetical protein
MGRSAPPYEKLIQHPLRESHFLSEWLKTPLLWLPFEGNVCLDEDSSPYTSQALHRPCFAGELERYRAWDWQASQGTFFNVAAIVARWVQAPLAGSGQVQACHSLVSSHQQFTSPSRSAMGYLTMSIS